MIELADLHRLPSFLARYAVKRVRFGAPVGPRPAVTYGTYRTSSTSIHHAIRAWRGGVAIKAHALAPQHLGNVLREATEPIVHASGVPLSSHYGNFAVRHGIVEAGRAADVVLTIRDPIAVPASVLYSFAGWWTPELRAALAAGADPEAALGRTFFGRFPRNLMVDWMRHDVRAGLGWDWSAVPFDHERGWSAYEQGALRILVLRADVADAGKEEALRSFLEIPGLRLERSNAGRGFDKGRPAIADAVGRMIAAHPDWIESVVTDPVTRHFWGERGASRIRDRWSTVRIAGAAA
jgi:hypothetical protein